MREKLLDLMKSEGLKPSQLADLLEINPAGISHILAGRNKPSFELLQKILRRFPRISPDWLLLDSGSMYRNNGFAADSAETEANSPATSAQSPGRMNSDNGLFGSSGFGLPGSNASAADNMNNPESGRFAGRSPGNEANGGNIAAHGSVGSAAGTGGVAGAGGGPSSAAGTVGGIGGIGGRANAAIQRIVIFYDDQTCECYFPTMR